ncbi:sulfotransferase domain-containing protein [Candidatus Villigracilis saccharophilus]|uniref:sulfotransferase domain-containing protein n=1 Tax=Candidatus Villigracilis saccharophilus TaxID=3140684 RepID=UPI003135782A|nr:sulfotransferase domain-containing protein [Anaerolineales bacterium]
MAFKQKIRRTLRPAGKTAQAILRWKRFSFNDAAPVFGNSKPKSGSHLLLQILNGFTQIMPYRYVAADPIRTIKYEGGRRSTEEILTDLKRVPNGVIGWGYVDATKENTSFLTEGGRVNYFIYRDPRDMLVSQVFFATDMHGDHGMHDYYNSLPDFGARLNVAITGIDKDEFKMVSVKQRYEGVFQWLEQKHVMCIRFEDLINNRDVTLNAMLDEVEKTGYKIPTPREKALSVLTDAIQPKKSHTFRSGKTGGWKQHFTEEHKKLFIDVSGDLLERLGYEKNNDW